MAGTQVAAQELTITGLTGVGMRLQIAGPGTRSYAFLIDWQIRLLAALAWLLLGLLARRTLWQGLDGKLIATLFEFGVIAPAVLIYVLYHPVLEVLLRGRTPGKRRAGVRIVTREGATPGVGALLIRNLFRLIDSLPAFYFVGLVCCLASSQRVRIGDLAAGTVLIVDEGQAARPLGRLGALLTQTRLDPGALQLIEELLDRWDALEPRRRAELARTLLVRVGRGPDAAQLGALDERALQRQLRSLLGRTPGP